MNLTKNLNFNIMKKHKLYSLNNGDIVSIETLRKGELIKLFRAGKPTKKTYEVDGYCKFNKAYQITDITDFCADRYIKKGTQIIITDY